MKEHEAAGNKTNVIDKVKQEYAELNQFLERERDELRVKVHLANADMKDQWRRVDEKWEKLQARAAVVSKVTEESARDVGEATQLVGDELKEAYRRIRDTLNATRSKP